MKRCVVFSLDMEGCTKPKDLLKQSVASAKKKSPRKQSPRKSPRKRNKEWEHDSSDDDEDDGSDSDDSNKVKRTPKKVKTHVKKGNTKEEVSENHCFCEP